MPIIRSLSTAVAASGLPFERGGSSVVGRGRSAQTMKNPNDTVGNRTRDLPTCSAVPISHLHLYISDIIVVMFRPTIFVHSVCPSHPLHSS